jgi:hypothetical protein
LKSGASSSWAAAAAGAETAGRDESEDESEDGVGVHELSGTKGEGEAEREWPPDESERRRSSLSGRPASSAAPPFLGVAAAAGCGEKKPEPLRVRPPPGVRVLAGLGRCRASAAALRRRLVVPLDFVVPDRAEQTTTTLCCDR